MEKDVEWKDIAGRDIKVGDYIVYAALWDRSATLKFARVTALATRTSHYPDTTTPTLRLRSVDRGYDRETAEAPHLRKWLIQKGGKDTVLGFLDRLMVVERSQVPEGALKVLDAHR